MLGELFRREGFCLLDAMKGSPIRNHARELDEIYLKRSGNPKALEELLKHAIATVPFYGKIATPDISFFPVVSKKEYRADFESFRSKDYLKEDELHKVFTSGSTGTPFMAYQDREKIRWHQAGLTLLNRRIGWQIGDQFMFFRLWGVAHNEGKLSQIKSNMLPVDVMGFTDERKEETCQTIIRKKHLHLILGYASALTSLAEYIIQQEYKPDELGIRLVIADSENLSETAKKLIEQAFGCTVLNRYGNNENGILGITMPGDNRMHINFPEYYVELLKLDSDEPVKIGECGRIVITDLYNKAFPFIRYDTGDLGIASEMYEQQCITLQQLVGRVSGSLRNTNGIMIGETAATAFFEDMIGLGRYQIAQTGKRKYQVRVEKTERDLDEQIAIQAKKCFGSDADVEVLHIDKINQGRNGKYKITSYEVEDKS